jgi:Tol biopolymer transport system component
LSLSLALATVLVIARGDQVGAAPVVVAPEPGSAEVSTRALIRLRFARPMKPETVETNLRIEPATAGRFTWNGVTMTFTPIEPLRAAATYRVILEPGAAEQRGRTTGTPFRWQFQTRAPAVVALRRASEGTPTNLWLLTIESGLARALTSELVDIIDFAVAPGGDRVAYVRQDTPNQTSIWLLDLQSGLTRRLTEAEDASFTGPAWAPDGDVLVVERRVAVTGTIANPKLMLIRADGRSGGLLYGRGDEVGFGARWSPDGTRVAFFDPVRQAVVIFNFTPDRVTIPVQTTMAFAWSPDSRQLAIEDIVSDGHAFQHVLLLADAASGTTQRLTTATNLDEAAPAWSPDGRALAFTRRPTTGMIGGAQPVVLDLASGTTRSALVQEDRTLDMAVRSWSPDGGRLIVDQLVLGGGPQVDPQLAMIDLATGVAQRLGPGMAAAWLP